MCETCDPSIACTVAVGARQHLRLSVRGPDRRKHLEQWHNPPSLTPKPGGMDSRDRGCISGPLLLISLQADSLRERLKSIQLPGRLGRATSPLLCVLPGLVLCAAKLPDSTQQQQYYPPSARFNTAANGLTRGRRDGKPLSVKGGKQEEGLCARPQVCRAGSTPAIRNLSPYASILLPASLCTCR